MDHVPASMDSLTEVTCVLQLQSISRLKEAPIVTRIVTYTLTVLDPNNVPGQADDAIDNDIQILLDALDEVEGLAWTSAERGTGTAKLNPAFVITLTFTYTKEA